MLQSQSKLIQEIINDPENDVEAVPGRREGGGQARGPPQDPPGDNGDQGDLPPNRNGPPPPPGNNPPNNSPDVSWLNTKYSRIKTNIRIYNL